MNNDGILFSILILISLVTDRVETAQIYLI